VSTSSDCKLSTLRNFNFKKVVEWNKSFRRCSISLHNTHLLFSLLIRRSRILHCVSYSHTIISNEVTMMSLSTYELTMSQFTQITQSDLLTVTHFCRAHQVVMQQFVMKVKPTQFAESPLQNIVCLMLCMLDCFFSSQTWFAYLQMILMTLRALQSAWLHELLLAVHLIFQGLLNSGWLSSHLLIAAVQHTTYLRQRTSASTFNSTVIKLYWVSFLL